MTLMMPEKMQANIRNSFEQNRSDSSPIFERVNRLETEHKSVMLRLYEDFEKCYMSVETFNDPMLRGYLTPPFVGGWWTGEHVQAMKCFNTLGFRVTNVIADAVFFWQDVPALLPSGPEIIKMPERTQTAYDLMLTGRPLKKYLYINDSDLVKVAGEAVSHCFMCGTSDADLIRHGRSLSARGWFVCKHGLRCPECSQIIHYDTFIYLIWAESTNRYKIGFSSSGVKGRLTSLQTASPFPLHLLAFREGSTLEEHFLHEDLKEYRVCGEWFEMKDRDALLSQFLGDFPNLLSTDNGIESPAAMFGHNGGD